MFNLVLATLIFLVSSPIYAFTYVALGDSITSGTNTEPGALYGYHNSWATGKSLDQSFAKGMGEGLTAAYNASLPGAISGIIGYQESFAEAVKATYVSILIGANDLCWGMPDQTYPHIRYLVERLNKREHVSKIFVSTVVDIDQLYRLSTDALQCNLAKVMCPNYFLASDAHKKEVMGKIISANDRIKSLPDEFSKVVVVDALEKTVYRPEDISSVDCFHPSKVGQQRIADAFIEAFHAAVPEP